MYWLDVAIIYFALGAPFGVLRITAKRKVTPFAYLRMASGYLLWPLVAIRNVARFFITKSVAKRAQINELDAIRTELEKALFPNAGALSDAAATRNNSAATRRDLYAFREVFYRYTGLAEAANAQSQTHPSSLIPHPSPLLRSACIARRDRQKLESQLAEARSELIALLAPHSRFISDKLFLDLDN